MIDIKKLVENKEYFEKKYEERQLKVDLDGIIELNNKRKEIISKVENLKNQKNVISKEIGIKVRNKENIEELKKESSLITNKIENYDNELKTVEEKLSSKLLYLPNPTLDSIPVGKNENDNKFIKEVGVKPVFNFNPIPHWDIVEKLGIIDFKASSNLSGARFALLKNTGAKLERALINFMLDIHTKDNKYTEVLPPFIVTGETMTGTGQLPKFKDDLFKCEDKDMYLIPTGEVPLTNIHKNEMLMLQDLPIYYTAWTPCFRSEAGSYGKDVRGIIRQHQFNKIELVKLVLPETGVTELENLLKDAEIILQLLKLPYRVIELCTGDIGFSACKTYDIEVWMPGLNKYLEISSCSLCSDFQARRANIRFKRDKKSKPEFVSTLNGSGLAVGRTAAAIIENFQKEDGTFEIPEILKKYIH